jgi:O-methyltransferase
MLGTASQVAHKTLRRFGFDLIRWHAPQSTDSPSYLTVAEREITDRVRPYTMTSTDRLVALTRAVDYVVRARIQGAIVECGVWKGGSMMAVALTLLRLRESRKLFLYDTFQGMTPPSDLDIDLFGTSAETLLAKHERKEGLLNPWAFASLDTVRDAMLSTGYDSTQVRFVQGRVEETIPQMVPDRISILRLDTDWYASTRHELEHLYPLLSPGGVLIIDDYGHFAGARQAVDEYFDRHGAILLCPIDYTGRIAVKST